MGLAKRNARVILACRSVERREIAAVQEVAMIIVFSTGSSLALGGGAGMCMRKRYFCYVIN